MAWEKLPHKNTIKMIGGSVFLMWKIGGGFWPFLAGKRAGSDSEVLATLLHSNFSHGGGKLVRDRESRFQPSILPGGIWFWE